jgi:hypothetical protein
MPLEWDEVAGVDPAAFTLVTAPARLAECGDASDGIDEAAGSLDGLLALSAEQEAQGLGDAPWPPHYRKQEGEPARVAPSRKKRDGVDSPTGRRRSTQPLVTVAKARHEADARAGLERWKARHPAAAARLEADDVLVDAMRGRSSTWTRIRVNLRHVPEADRPEAEPPDPDYDPWRELRERWERERAREGAELRDAGDDEPSPSVRRSPSGKSPSRRSSRRESSREPDPKTRSSS